MTNPLDVAIIGGGPAGSTAGCLLKKYAPRLRVGIFERERFPREHVGESQLPPIGHVLDEMGVWNDVEAAGFPIKIGATYRWGASDDLWDFDFVKGLRATDYARPARFEGVRRETAFQVDRARYDKILLDHARGLGVDVHEGTPVREILHEADRVTTLRLENGEEVRPRYVVDASGGAGLLRRALGIGTTTPSSLKNIAIWRCWENPNWAEGIGINGTRVFVMSLGYGWIWFIPLGPTRTSIGLIVPADYYKASGEGPEALYERALVEEPLVRAQVENATPDGEVSTTKDWSFLADRVVGENWFLAGESAGFADPILAAGMTLAHQGAREVAYTILALEKGGEDGAWLRRVYEEAQRKRLWQHIRFADYWYSANAQFSDLKEFTREIARDAGLDLDADAAFQWLGTGGFTTERLGAAALGSFDVRALKALGGRLGDRQAAWTIEGKNRFTLDMAGTERVEIAHYENGRIERVVAHEREGRRLPLFGIYKAVVRALKWGAELETLERSLETVRRASFDWVSPLHWRLLTLQTLEGMVTEGWVHAERDRDKPGLVLDAPQPQGATV